MERPVEKQRPLFRSIGAIILLITLYTSCREASPPDYIHNYYPLVYQGDLAFFKKEYELAYDALRQAVELKNPPNFEPYRELEKLADICAILGKSEEAIEYIRQLIERGYPLETFQQDPSYQSVWQHPKWQVMIDSYPYLRTAYLERIDLALRRQIIEMNERDQLYRSRPDRGLYRTQQLKLDSVNMAQLQEIFESKGYPNADLIGHESIDSTPDLGVQNILMHSPDSLRQIYFIPKIRSFVENGQCPPRLLAMLIDQYHLTHDGYQLYGTMIGQSGTVEYVKDARDLDERRQSIGLPSLHLEFQRDSVIRMQYMLQ